jgi:hypothetical protein
LVVEVVVVQDLQDLGGLKVAAVALLSSNQVLQLHQGNLYR